MRIKSIYPLLLFFLMVASIAEAVEYPRPAGFVNDFAGVMKPETVNELEAVLTDLTQKTGAEVAVVTVKNIGGLDLNGYAVELFKNWGIGSKEKNDGVLLLLALEERKVRIEVGYGLEPLITDARSGMIRDQYLIPYFKRNDFNTGLRQGALAIAALIAKDRGVTLSAEALRGPVQAPARPGASGRGFPPIQLIVIVLVIFFFLTSGRGGFLSGCLPGCLLGSMLGGGYRRGPFDSYGGFGGGFGGGGGGGFGGFGGGFSGGGGASGSF